MNTPVSFEIAKLLKEKGFNLYCTWSYWKTELTSETPGYALEDGTTSQENYYDFERYYAPTIAEVVMWLYEKYEIWLRVTPIPYSDNITHWRWEYMSTNYATRNSGWKKVKDHMSPTEAYSEAIKYCLTKLL